MCGPDRVPLEMGLHSEAVGTRIHQGAEDEEGVHGFPRILEDL